MRHPALFILLLLGSGPAVAEFSGAEADEHEGIDLGGVTLEEVSPSLHCIDTQARRLRRIAERPWETLELPDLPVQGDASVSSSLQVDLEDRSDRPRPQMRPEDMRLTGWFMKPFQKMHEQVHARRGEDPYADDGSGFRYSKRLRVRGGISASAHMHASSRDLLSRGVEDCAALAPEAPGGTRRRPEGGPPRPELPDPEPDLPGPLPGGRLPR